MILRQLIRGRRAILCLLADIEKLLKEHQVKFSHTIGDLRGRIEATSNAQCDNELSATHLQELVSLFGGMGSLNDINVNGWSASLRLSFLRDRLRIRTFIAQQCSMARKT